MRILQRKKISRKAQAIAEYAILIAAAVATLTVMSVLLVRALQGKARESADVFGGGEQYDKDLTIVRQFDPAGIDFALPEDTSVDTCEGVVARVNAKEQLAAQRRAEALQLDTRAQEIEQQMSLLGMLGTDTQDLLDLAQDLRNQAQAKRAEADTLEAEANQLRSTDHPECFSGG